MPNILFTVPAQITWLHTLRDTHFHTTQEAVGWDLRMRLRKNRYIASECLFSSPCCINTKAYLSTMTLMLNSGMCCKAVSVTLWLLQKWDFTKNGLCACVCVCMRTRLCKWPILLNKHGPYSRKSILIICHEEQSPYRSWMWTSFIIQSCSWKNSCKFNQSPHYSHIIITISNLFIWVFCILFQFFICDTSCTKTWIVKMQQEVLSLAATNYMFWVLRVL